jgi:hypothetical protein
MTTKDEFVKKVADRLNIDELHATSILDATVAELLSPTIFRGKKFAGFGAARDNNCGNGCGAGCANNCGNGCKDVPDLAT